MDLNRNYPCFCGATGHHLYGLYGTSKPRTALETKAVLDLQLKYHFHFASDDHGGIETIYHPYGCQRDNICDLEWFLWAGEKFANQVHDDCGNGWYFRYCSDGVGHWYTEMYESHGTRIDYTTYYGHGKGMGPETSTKKILEENNLRSRWEWLREAYFSYFENLLLGVQGFVTDAITKEPIFYAKMTREGDFDNAHVYSDSLGFYLRFTETGTFDITFSHPDYNSKTFNNYDVERYDKKYVLNVELDPLVKIDHPTNLKKQGISFIPYKNGMKISINKPLSNNCRVGIYNLKGTLLRVLPITAKTTIWDGKDEAGIKVGNGYYIARIKLGDQIFSENFILGK
jgi:hypothetical protein